MKELIEKIQGQVKKYVGRARWATFWREDRKRRELAYGTLAKGYHAMFLRMWERLGPPNGGTPEIRFIFSKATGTGVLCWRWMEKDHFSHIWLIGKEDRNKAESLFDISRREDIPYYISDEIIAATAVASLLAEQNDDNQPVVDEETVNGMLARYYEWQEFNPLEISEVWSSRLNTMVCNFWKMTPIMRRTVELKQTTELSFSEAREKAFAEAKVPDLPDCIRSNNGDGRINMSYDDSYFYTIDHHGMVVCKEFPNEYLDISDYEVMKTVAATIYRDITGNQNLNDEGIGGANWLLEEEPEWINGNLMPCDRDKVQVKATTRTTP